MNYVDNLTIFIDRMKKLNVTIELHGNYPWIYIHKINNNRIREEDYFLGNHGFTIAFYPKRPREPVTFTDISKIFKLIRKYKDESFS